MSKTLLLLILLPLSVLAQRLQVDTPVRFLALGDSYTIGESVPAAQNWPHQLRDSLAARSIATDTLRIIATTGWRTDNLLAAIQNQNLDSAHYNLVFLLIGVNNQYQGRPVSQYITEFPGLVDSAIRYARGDTSHVFIVSIPDYAFTPYGQSTGNQAQISMQLDTYNLIAKQFADSFHIRFFDITPISRQGLADPTLVAGDGLHPSGKQYAMWVHLMLQTIDSSYRQIDTPTGISNNTIQHIRMYPNPVKDDLTVITDKDGAEAYLQLIDVLGQVVLERKLKATTTAISMAHIPAGIYTARVSSPGMLYTGRVVRE